MEEALAILQQVQQLCQTPQEEEKDEDEGQDGEEERVDEGEDENAEGGGRGGVLLEGDFIKANTVNEVHSERDRGGRVREEGMEVEEEDAEA